VNVQTVRPRTARPMLVTITSASAATPRPALHDQSRVRDRGHCSHPNTTRLYVGLCVAISFVLAW
jgi:hypothetical protein